MRRLIIIFILSFVVFQPLHATEDDFGNTTITSFHTAKKILRELYKHWQLEDNTPFNTIYCGCRFTNGYNVVNSSCGYTPRNANNYRAYIVEWEHIVPASVYGHQFDEWINKHKYTACAKLTGRQCASKLNNEFKRMEADMYNLYPAIGEINFIRSNHAMADLPTEIPSIFDKCYFKLYNKKVQPRHEVRGDIARVYFYMQYAYPTFKIIDDDEMDTFIQWSFLDPISVEEKMRNEAIMAIQKNCNPFVLDNCIK